MLSNKISYSSGNKVERDDNDDDDDDDYDKIQVAEYEIICFYTHGKFKMIQKDLLLKSSHIKPIPRDY